MDGCDVTVRASGSRALVLLAGELDVASADAVAGRLASIDLRAVTAVEVDVSGLRFCDVTGFGAVEALRERAEAAGVPFHLLEGAQPPVRRLLSVLPAPRREPSLPDAARDTPGG